MAASVARAVQAVRPHSPLIAFPVRVKAALGFDPSSVPAIPKSSPTPAASPARNIISTDLPTSTLASSYQGQIGSTKRGTGIDFNLLPNRLKRRPLNEMEIEYINRGGPE